jgi:hypothetical protein
MDPFLPPAFLCRTGEPPVLRLTIGAGLKRLSTFHPVKGTPISDQEFDRDPDHAVKLDYKQLLAFLLTLPPDMISTAPKQDNRKQTRSEMAHNQLPSAPKVPCYVSFITCGPCQRIRYEVKCFTQYPLFTLRFRAGCVHATEQWLEEKAQANRKVFRLDCTRAFCAVLQGTIPMTDAPILKQFGQWMCMRKFVPIEGMTWVERLSYTPGGLRYRHLMRRGATSLTHFIDSLPGYTKVRVLRHGRGKFSYCRRPVVSFTWIPPSAVTAYQWSNYIQLDASFRPARPFVYSVPQGIVRNEAAPLALVVGVSEDTDLYQHFIDDMTACAARLGCQLLKKPVLSDQGSALKSFCALNQILQYFCHRHLIELWGANSPLGILVARVLREKSARSYLALRPQLISDAGALLEADRITAKEHAAFVEFLSDEFPHGLWHRMPFGISSCSNHAERFHGVVNQHLETRAGLADRLSVITEQMTSKMFSFKAGDGRRRQIREVFAQLRKAKAPRRDTCSDEDCVAYIQMMTIRYGIDDFPCKHTVSADKWRHFVPRMLHIDWELEGPIREAVHDMAFVDRVKPLPEAFGFTPDDDGVEKEENEEGEEDIPADEQHQSFTWDDIHEFTSEHAMTNNDGIDAIERGDKAVVHDIVEGALRLCPHPLSAEELFVDVWEHLKHMMHDTDGSDDQRKHIASQCKMEWWSWAETRANGRRPFGPHCWSRPDLTLGPIIE